MYCTVSIRAYTHTYTTAGPYTLLVYGHILDLVSWTSNEPRTPFMIHVDKPFSKPMNTVTKHTNISFQTIYLLSSFRPRTPTILIFGSPIDIFELTMSKNSRSSSSSSSSSLSSSSGNVKLSKVVAAIPRAFVSLANPAANSASFQTS